VQQADYHDVVGDALAHLIDGLAPFVDRVLRGVLPSNVPWTEILRRKDALAGRRGGRYHDRDLSLLLRALTERLGELGYPFDPQLSRQGHTLASELRDVRNRWAHNETFSAAAAFRALDTTELLLREVRATTQAEAVAALKPAVLADLAPWPSTADADQTGGAAPGEQGSVTAAQGDMPPATCSTTPVRTDGSARLDMQAVPVLSYAMAHCEIAVIGEVVVELLEGPERRGATLELDVVCASGSLGGPKVALVDLEPGRRTVLGSVDLVLDPARMLAVDQQQPGQIRAVLRDAAGDVLASTAVPVTILAAHQWMATPLQLGMEMLAAHVQPNAPAIQPLLVESSDLLREATGSSAIDGYQSENPERVDAIARAVYDAIRARDVRYAEPPGNWGSVGQKVRTPAEVLEGRLGTCLDTTLTYAAALEQAGVNSTIWLLDDHALLGYWRQDGRMATVATADPGEVINAVDLEAIRLVETTALTGGPESRPFEDACRSARERVAVGLDDVVGVTDVRQAREARIYPLPARTVTDDGQVQVVYYQAGAGPVIQPYVGTPGQGGERRRDVPERVQRWKNQLLDLSLRNRLINFTERSGHRLEVPGEALGRLEDQISAETPITLLASDHVPGVEAARGVRFGRDLPAPARELLLADKRAAYIDITSAQYTTTLRNLAYRARTIAEETGANNLYLALGTLAWRFADRDLRSPLVLVPVHLSTTTRGTTYRVTLDDAGASTPNYCLLEKLRLSFGLEVPGLENPTEDASGIDLAAAFEAMRVALVEAGLPFRVEDTVHLAILQFAKYPLWKDLDEHWEGFTQNSLVRHLVHTPLDRFDDPVPAPDDVDLDELGSRLPLPADSSQLEAVAQGAAGRTFVLEGPPGTGKSQTIANLLAHALDTGKRVLFVAEKRAALDVVKQRLEAVGLGELSLDLHDKNARPAAVRAQVRAALELAVRPDMDALRANAEALVAARRRLATYAERLHEPNAADLSLYDARNRDLAAADQGVAPMDVPASLVRSGTPEQVDAVRSALRALPDVADLARPGRRHPWRFVDIADGSLGDPVAAVRAAAGLDDALGHAVQAGVPGEVLALVPDLPAMEAWARLAAAPRWGVEIVDLLAAPARRDHLQSVRAQLDALAGAQHPWEGTVRPEAMDLDIPAIHASALEADAAGIFRRRSRRRAVLARLEPALAVPPKTVRPADLSGLTAQLAATHAAVSAVRQALVDLPVTLAGPGWNPAVPAHAAAVRDQIDWLLWLGEVLGDDGSPWRQALRRWYVTTPVGALGEPLSRVAAAWTELGRAVVVDPVEAERWADGTGFLVAWWERRSQRRTDTTVEVERWLALVAAVEPLRAVGMHTARQAILDGAIDPDEAVLAFDRGLARASVGERLEATALDAFEVSAHNRTIERFTRASESVRSELPRVIPGAVVRRRRFNADADGGQIGALRRQLERQRGGMSVRALMQHFGDLITQIMPCVLASPESVARFFPARPGLFDVVVFDEASQIRVADAIGAMGRGSSVIVVGDSKQMPPTTFAEVSVDAPDEEIETLVPDEESILTECVGAQVPRTWLSWHYRSQDESLIAFSNRHYYEDRLSSFPAPLPADARKHPAGFGISLVRVDGTFERTGQGRRLRTNDAEARAIVAEVQRRFAASPDRTPSLGIITFNIQQRNYIDNLLRDCGDDRVVQALDEPDGLFVKNLENVQGDERDCILFSVAFSANEKGVVPLNFGPLSRPGGERRLNVAITRARRQVVLYASFDPEQLRAEETLNAGVKHLKAYLEMAARGVDALPDDGRRQRVVDRHRDEIAEALRALGYAVWVDVGLSDFRVDLEVAHPADPEQPLVAVLLDGPSWRQRRTVADRDGLPVDVLQRMMRWPAVERVWLPEWLARREETLQRLAGVVEAAQARVAGDGLGGGAAVAGGAGLSAGAVAGGGLGGTAGVPAGRHVRVDEPALPPTSGDRTTSCGAAGEVSGAVIGAGGRAAGLGAPVGVGAGDARHEMHVRAAPPHAEEVEIDLPWGELEDGLRDGHPDLVLYEPWEPEAMGDLSVLDMLPARRAVDRVQRAVVAVVDAEGPVHVERLVRLVAASFGLSKVHENRHAAILKALPASMRPKDGFVWPERIDPERWLTVRVPEAGRNRPLKEVPLIEIANAMRVAAEESGGAQTEELKRAALAKFGSKRMTDAIGRRLDEAFHVAVAKSRIRHTYGGVYVATDPA